MFGQNNLIGNRTQELKINFIQHWSLLGLLFFEICSSEPFTNDTCLDKKKFGDHFLFIKINFGHNILYPKFFETLYVLGPTFFRPLIFCPKLFIFVSTFFPQKLFWSKKISRNVFDPKFCGAKILWTQIFLWAQLFWTMNFWSDSFSFNINMTTKTMQC